MPPTLPWPTHPCRPLCTQIMHLVEYVSELSMIDIGVLKWAPSMVAAAAVHVALCVVDADDAYPVALARHSGYTFEQVGVWWEGGGG